MKKLILLIIQLFSILYKKTRLTRRKKLYCTFIVSCVMLILPMMPVHVKLSITCSSLKNVMTWVK